MSCTVLLVDDDDDIRETLADALRTLDHEVIEARDGKQALDALAMANPLPRLIVLDLMMPVMDGVEFRQHQLADVRVRDIPVLVLSADSGLERRIEGLAIAESLRKPVRLAVLTETIERLCGISPAG